MEIWKEIIGVDGSFVINDSGVIKNLSTNKIHLGSLARGYKQINLLTNGKYKTYMVHRLVAKAFLTSYDEKLMVNHIDFNKSNNHISNLEMVTNRENQCHSFKLKNKYIGVSYHSKYNIWTAQIMINGKLKYIGRFKSELEAYKGRCDFEKNNGIVNKYL